MRLSASWPSFLLPILLGLFALLVLAGQGVVRAAWLGPVTVLAPDSSSVLDDVRAEVSEATEAQPFGLGARQSDDSPPATEGDLSSSLCDIPDEDADEAPLVLSAAHLRTLGSSRVVLRADPAPSVPPLLVELPPPRG